MARLKFDGPVAEYSPAFGLTFQVGEAEYPDELKAALLATGRFKHVPTPRAPKAAGEKE